LEKNIYSFIRKVSSIKKKEKSRRINIRDKDKIETKRTLLSQRFDKNLR